MKKIAYTAMASAFALALAACGGTDNASDDATADNVEMPADEAMSTEGVEAPSADDAAEAATDAAEASEDAADATQAAANDAEEAANDAAAAAEAATNAAEDDM